MSYSLVMNEGGPLCVYVSLPAWVRRQPVFTATRLVNYKATAGTSNCYVDVVAMVAPFLPLTILLTLLAQLISELYSPLHF